MLRAGRRLIAAATGAARVAAREVAWQAVRCGSDKVGREPIASWRRPVLAWLVQAWSVRRFDAAGAAVARFFAPSALRDDRAVRYINWFSQDGHRRLA